jgi:hypothetical protein
MAVIYHYIARIDSMLIYYLAYTHKKVFCLSILTEASFKSAAGPGLTKICYQVETHYIQVHKNYKR